ncbi:hypothetical protein [Nocardia sp. NPDC058497]|uniref:hypothetical protein n=1 Tax=Nocardia sp. NPDC058497 TaxID=3346529 RepID=UPI00365FA731
MSLEFDEERADKLSREVCEIMAEAANPTDWLRIELVYLAVGAVTEKNLFGVWRHETRPIEIVPAKIEAPLQELRRMMYSPGAGTWFLTRYYLEPDMTSTVVYDFDYDPKFKTDLNPSEWRRELDQFPRDPQYLPKWLEECAA